MSFASLAGDFVQLVQCAHKTFRNCQSAGEEYVDIACEVRCLHSVLRALRSEAQKPNSKLFAQDPASTSQLIATADGCKNVLNNLDNVLVRYEGLKIDGQASAGKKLWQKFKFGSKVEHLAVIRGKLVTYTSILSIFIDTIQAKEVEGVARGLDMGSTKTPEQMSGQFERMRKEVYKIAAAKRTEERQGTMISTLSLSTYVGNEEIVWEDFRKELAKKGFRMTSLERHKYVLQAYMLKLDQSSLLNQDAVPSKRPSRRTQWWAKKTYMETINAIDKIKPNKESMVSGKTASSVKVVRQEANGGAAKKELPTKPIKVLTTIPARTIPGEAMLTWDQESTASSEQDTPSEDEPTDSASSSEAEPDDSPASDGTKGLDSEAISIALPSRLKSADTEPKEKEGELLVSSRSIVFDWLDEGETEYPKQRPQAYVRDENEEDELTAASPPINTPPSTDAESPPTGANNYFPETPIISTPNPLIDSNQRGLKKPTVIRRRSEGSSKSRDAEFITIAPTQRSQVGKWNRWNYTGAQTMSIDDAIAIEGTGNGHRTRHREGERRHISSRPPSTSSNWNEVSKATQSKSRRHSTYVSPTRPQSMPTSTIRTSAPQVYQSQSHNSSRPYRVHSRSTPTSPIRSQPPSLHQYRTNPKSKVHYRTSATFIVDPPTSSEEPSAHTSTHTSPLPSPPRPLKGILKTPTGRFPEDPEPSREGVAAHKDAVLNGIPPSARWTKISRKLVNPEALEAGKERYEILEEEGAVIVLRVVGREEVEGYAEITRRIRASRETKLAKERRRPSSSSANATTPTDYDTDALLFTIT